jgi:hypothetical protein
MSEQRLRNLLRQAVPEAPDLDAAAIGRRAERERRHRTVTAGAAAAVLAIGGTTLGIAALNGHRGAERLPSEGVTQPRHPEKPDRAPSPYDPPPCTAQQPYVVPSDLAATDLDSVVAVRLCPDFDPRSPGTQPPLGPDQLAEVEDAEALVHALARFTAEVRGLPTGLPAYCTTAKGSYEGQAFAFYRADGSRADLPTVGCELATIEGRAVHGGALRALYLEALDRQRGATEYTRPFDDELACDTGERGGPVRPGRERLVAAGACDLPPGAESIPEGLQPGLLSDTQLAELNKAWARPGDPIVRGPSGEHECVDNLPEPPSYIVAATDRSDVVQLIGTPCGFLVWHGGEVHKGATIPTTLAALGL